MKQLLQRIRNIVLNNKGLKAAALLMAVVTWYVIQPSISFETVVSDVPIRVTTDPGWAVMEQSAAMGDVRVRGSRETIRQVEREQPEITVDIRGKPHAQTLRVNLGPRNIRVPAGGRVLYVRPSEIEIQLDQEVEKTVPVRPHFQGSPPEGLLVDRVILEPPVVSISGPGRRLEGIESLRTLPIDLDRQLQSFKKRVGIAPPSPVWGARIQPDRVEVDVVLVEHTATRTFTNIPVHVIIHPAADMRTELDPPRLTVILKGRTEMLDEITPQDIRALVDGTRLEPSSTTELRVRLLIPDTVQLGSVDPSIISVTVLDP